MKCLRAAFIYFNSELKDVQYGHSLKYSCSEFCVGTDIHENNEWLVIIG